MRERKTAKRTERIRQKEREREKADERAQKSAGGVDIVATIVTAATV